MTDQEPEFVFKVDSPPEVEPGVYIGTLIGLRPFEFTDPQTQETKRLIEWQFGTEIPIPLPDGTFYEPSGVTSMATGPKSKAFAWLVALLGPAAVTPSAQFRASVLIGRQAQLTIGPDKKG